MGNSIETKKSEATMRGKYQNQDTNDPRKIPAEYLDENGNWRMLDRRERALMANSMHILTSDISRAEVTICNISARLFALFLIKRL